MREEKQLSTQMTGNKAGLQKRELAYKLGPYYFQERRLCNLIVTGQGDRAHLLYEPLWAAAGRVPVIILHNQSHDIRAEAALVWSNKFGTLDEGNIWFGNDGSFEPFLGLDMDDIVTILENMAKSMELTYTPAFAKVIKAHLKILYHMDCDFTLSGLFYLCSFEDLQEFQENILQLSCSEREQNLILADLGLSGESQEQFDLFRLIIRRLAREARHCGWDADPQVGYMNLGMALKHNAMMLLNVNNTQAPLVMAYISEELRIYGHREFVLVLDDVNMENTPMLPTLYNLGREVYLCLSGSNVLKMMGVELNQAQAFCDRMDRIVMLKQKVAPTAEALAELLGTMEMERTSSSTRSSNRRSFDLFSNSHGKSVTVTREDRNRLRPEELLSLGPKQAIIFDMGTNQIIRI